MWDDEELIGVIVGSQALEQLMCRRIKEAIETFIEYYENLKEKHIRGGLDEVRLKDMLDNEQDILALERVYVCFSGDWDYVSVVTGEKIYDA